MEWTQVYDPLHSPLLSTLVAALPVILLLGSLGLVGWPAHRAAGLGLVSALLVAVAVYGMPWSTALASAASGACFGLFPIGWIVLSAIFLYTLTVETGQFEIVKNSVARVSADRRLQAILIAFSFGAFLEGAAGFGTPVAISAALMIGTGFSPLYAAALALIANTSPVAFGALGTPIITLAEVTQLPEDALSAMAGRQLPLFSLIVPGWLVCTMAGWRGACGVWPAIVVSGGSFAVVQFCVSNYFGPRLVDVAGGLASLVCLVLFLRFWRPRSVWAFPHEAAGSAQATAAGAADPAGSAGAAAAAAPDAGAGAAARGAHGPSAEVSRAELVRAWVPWVLLSVCVFLWGLQPVRTVLDGGLSAAALAARAKAGKAVAWWERPNLVAGVSAVSVAVPYLHNKVVRDEPVVARRATPEAAVFRFNWLSATGTGILVAALLSAAWLGIPPVRCAVLFGRTLRRMARPLATIAAMLALAYTTRYSGSDATLGLAFTRTGVLYPFFAALLGWLGVALTGSDTSSNALFGSLQKITAQGLVRRGLLPLTEPQAMLLMAAANSSGGVMGKMIDAQSIVVSAVATDQPGGEGEILRFVFWHSVALAALMGAVIMMQAYVLPWMIPGSSG